MSDTARKVFIKLSDVGNRPDMIIAILSKIQGLSDTPENLIKNTPCHISGKVALSLAEKAKSYLEQAGAVIELEDDETIPGPAPDENLYAEPSFETLTHHLTSLDDEETDAQYQAADSSPDVADVTYFDVDAEAEGDGFPSFEDEVSEVQVPEEVYETAPSSRHRPIARKTQSGKRGSVSRILLRIVLVVVVIALFGGGIWLYLSGQGSQFAQRYEQSPVVGTVGTLEIENPQNAIISLSHVVATRVFEPILFEGTTVHLQQGDYYVEAQKGSQILKYPVYVRGRGHKIAVSVSFPTKPIPDDMVYIPAGWFRMGNKETTIAHFGFPDESPDIDVYVGAFLLSKYEVMNREYAEFIDAGGYEKQVYWGSLIGDWNSLVEQVPAYGRVYGNDGWDSVRKYIRTRLVDTDDRPAPRLWEDDFPPYEDGQANYPVTGITLYEAEAYCQWMTQKTGKLHRLPTEAEWEKAARGFEGYFFSYGNEYDATRANTESEGPKKVGSYLPNGFGAYDLTGNVWEWIADQYRDDTYQYLSDTYKDDIRNPKIFNEAQPYNRRIVRGGSFRSVNRINAKTTIRYPMFPNDWHTNIGFRYVTTP